MEEKNQESLEKINNVIQGIQDQLKNWPTSFKNEKGPLFRWDDENDINGLLESLKEFSSDTQVALMDILSYAKSKHVQKAMGFLYEFISHLHYRYHRLLSSPTNSLEGWCRLTLNQVNAQISYSVYRITEPFNKSTVPTDLEFSKYCVAYLNHIRFYLECALDSLMLAAEASRAQSMSTEVQSSAKNIERKQATYRGQSLTVKLPNELLLHILKFLPFSDLKFVAQVSRKFRKLYFGLLQLKRNALFKKIPLEKEGKGAAYAAMLHQLVRYQDQAGVQYLLKEAKKSENVNFNLIFTLEAPDGRLFTAACKMHIRLHLQLAQLSRNHVRYKALERALKHQLHIIKLILDHPESRNSPMVSNILHLAEHYDDQTLITLLILKGIAKKEDQLDVAIELKNEVLIKKLVKEGIWFDGVLAKYIDSFDESEHDGKILAALRNKTSILEHYTNEVYEKGREKKIPAYKISFLSRILGALIGMVTGPIIATFMLIFVLLRLSMLVRLFRKVPLWLDVVIFALLSVGLFVCFYWAPHITLGITAVTGVFLMFFIASIYILIVSYGMFFGLRQGFIHGFLGVINPLHLYGAFRENLIFFLNASEKIEVRDILTPRFYQLVFVINFMITLSLLLTAMFTPTPTLTHSVLIGAAVSVAVGPVFLLLKAFLEAWIDRIVFRSDKNIPVFSFKDWLSGIFYPKASFQKSSQSKNNYGAGPATRSRLKEPFPVKRCQLDVREGEPIPSILVHEINLGDDIDTVEDFNPDYRNGYILTAEK